MVGGHWDVFEYILDVLFHYHAIPSFFYYHAQHILKLQIFHFYGPIWNMIIDWAIDRIGEVMDLSPAPVMFGD